MPTYDYQCQACGHTFDEFQSITSSPLRKCPSCGKLKLKRLIGTGAGIIFKGSGFYETDYRSDAYKKSAKADSDVSKPAAAETKTETPGKKETSKAKSSDGPSKPKSDKSAA